ncbi:carboxypeptidase-like regulatory domain-containing protein [Candidatus Woesearchaeota archaeon]|nr:carboxypeptidase-like regulatory domain-containing protein [Candidatus Woesearchaeota archaeon]
MKTGLLLAFIFLAALSGLGLARGALLNCGVEEAASCDSEGKTTIFKLSGTTNAHAEIPSLTNYPYSLCCESSGLEISNSCETGISILKLSDVTDAHVQKPSEDTYPFDVCLYVDGMELSCQYQATCDEGYMCVASIYSDTNAHVTGCTDPYPIKVCCNCNGPVSGNVKNTEDEIVVGAKIDIMQGSTLKYSASTNSDGDYEINDVSCGTYNMVASAEGYLSSTKTDIVLPQEPVDFVLTSATECEDDCTYAGDDIIHEDCNGINGCEFCPPECEFCDIEKVVDSCIKNPAQPGWVRNYDDSENCPDGCVIECAGGCPKEKGPSTPSDVKCEGEENLIRLTKLVNYKGKLTKVVVVVCG